MFQMPGGLVASAGAVRQTVCTLRICLITTNSNVQTKILKTTPRNSEAPDRLSEELRRLTNMQNLYLLLQLLFPRLRRLAGAVNTKLLLQSEVLQWKQKGKGGGSCISERGMERYER